MRLKKNKKKYIYITFVFILIFVSLLSSLVFINFFSKRVNPTLEAVTEVKMKKKINLFINNTLKEINIDNKLINLVKNNKDEIVLINYETIKMKKIITEVTELLNTKIDKLCSIEGCIIDEIPFGLVFKTSFLNNLGPKIKVHYQFIDNVLVNIETEVKPYGLNNAYVEVRLCIEIKVKIYLPFLSKELIILSEVPISMNIVQGNVPEGYINSYQK